MKKKILIGSLLVLTLLLLMPSIPAIQQKTIEEGIKLDIQEKLDKIDLDDFKDIKTLEFRFPIIMRLIGYLMVFREARGIIYAFAAVGGLYGGGTIDYPLLYLRGGWLIITAEVMIEILNWLWEQN